MELFEMDLGPYGAPDFSLRDRLDMTGHASGRVDPHINSEVNISGTDYVVYRDLANPQLPGFNGMQND